MNGMLAPIWAGFARTGSLQTAITLFGFALFFPATIYVYVIQSIAPRELSM
jgi:hypothetical protein